MYISVRHYSSSSPAEVIRNVNESFVPIIRNLPGFRHYFAFDSGGGTVTSISIFDTQAQVDESNRRAADWVRKTIPTLITSAPQIIAGEASIHAMK